jgi:hypothetical protein
MKVIFLDIDGVMNSVKSEMLAAEEEGLSEFAYFCDNPHPIHTKPLNRIIKETGARIVISSTWRHSFSVIGLWRLLYAGGLRNSHVIDMTPTLNGQPRGEEIQAWLDMQQKRVDGYEDEKSWMYNPDFTEPVESFVILDDDADMTHLSEFLVHTDGQVGLTEEDADKAIAILNSGE